jgi:hypothetical protein
MDQKDLGLEQRRRLREGCERIYLKRGGANGGELDDWLADLHESLDQNGFFLRFLKNVAKSK